MKLIFCSQSQNVVTAVKPHSHPFYEIIITTEGSGTLRANGENIAINHGTVVVIPPNTEHENFSEQGFCDLYIQTDYFGSFNAVSSFMDETGDIESLALLLYTVWMRRAENYEAIASSLLSAIYEYSVSFAKGSGKYEFVRRLMALMAKHVGDTAFSIPTETARLGVSYDYMRRCFLSETGYTPLDYLTRMRIEHAKTSLVHNRNLTVQAIAAECGFCDQYYFSRCFKKLTGISPKAYRNQK